MAQRDLSTYRSVSQSVADRPGDLMQTVAKVGTAIIEQGQEAKINEGISAVQLELNQLQSQYQIDNEKDPMGAMDDYRQRRQELFDSYGDSISPLYRRFWNESVRKIGAQNDATQQGWALKQTRFNTVASINESMKNNFKLATINGENYGNSDETEVGALLDFATSKQHLAEFGNKNLGEMTTKEMLDGYDDDYMKHFLSGVSDVNPVKALKLMDDERVKGAFKDIDQFNDMKASIEHRALNADKIASQKQILGALRGENGLLAKSLESPVGYTQLNAEMDRLGLSPKSRDFFLQANGFKKSGTKVKLSEEEKGEVKEVIYNKILDLGKQEEITPDDLKSLQSEIYAAAGKDVLTKTETGQWLNQILNPYIAQKENTLSKFSDNGFIRDDLGLKGMQEAFDETLAIKPSQGQKKIGVLSERTNLKNRIRLYDTYMGYLAKEAASRNIPVGDIPSLDRPERRAIYAKAQNAAIKSFNADNYPELTNMKDTPNYVVPVYSSPSDLQPEYESAKGGAAITKDQIMETARNRNMSPSEVVGLLRQNGVIK